MFTKSSILLAAATLLETSVNAAFSDGSISDRDWSVTYTGYTDTLAFCTAFRAECIDYVGALDYHHALDCVTTQTGTKIYAFCGGTLKDANGDTGSGPINDFTSEVCPATTGCSIDANPITPTLQYGQADTVATSSSSTLAAAATSTTSAAAVATASTTGDTRIVTSITSSATATATATATAGSSTVISSTSALVTALLATTTASDLALATLSATGTTLSSDTSIHLLSAAGATGANVTVGGSGASATASPTGSSGDKVRFATGLLLGAALVAVLV